MSLLRQLLFSVTVAIIAILAGTLIFSINGARDYLSSQLQTESDNAATSLALSLSHPSNQDPEKRELLVTALFDSGRFAAIELRDTNQLVVVARQIDSANQIATPEWFSQVLPLRAPHSTRHVSDGLKQIGELTVIADDSAARTALWNSTVRVFFWVVLAGLLWIVFVIGLMRWLKRALHDEIEKQVDSIADGRPRTPGKASRQVADLMPASHVMTQARERVQASKKEAYDRIESLTVELNHDAVTSLPNRRYVMNELRRALKTTCATEESEKQTTQAGHLLLSRQRDLAALAAELPRDQVDGWLRSVGERLEFAVNDFTTSLHVGRLNGSDFAILIPDTAGPQAMLIAQAMQQVFLDSRIDVAPGRPCRWAFAMTDFVAGDDVSDVFARLDTALMAAESAGHSDIETLLRGQAEAGVGQRVSGEAAWRTLLTTALSKDYLGLAVQPANYGHPKAAHARYEATLTLRDPTHNDGEVLSGFSFMPAAVRLGLSASLDVRATQCALTWLDDNAGDLVVRVSVPSLLKPDFLGELQQTLETAKTPLMLRRLIIELDAYGLSAYPAEVRALCQVAHSAGVRVGLRGVAQQLDAVARVQGLPLDYIKLGGGFMADLEHSQGAISLLNAVMHTATVYRIKVLVDETPAEVAAMLLRDHGALLRA